MASNLAEAAAEAASLAEHGEERELATLRARWEDEVEGAARSADFRERAVAYRAIGQFRFRQKLELLRRGLEDDSPACREHLADNDEEDRELRAAAARIAAFLKKKTGTR
jgi:HEAT repeat protein